MYLHISEQLQTNFRTLIIICILFRSRARPRSYAKLAWTRTVCGIRATGYPIYNQIVSCARSRARCGSFAGLLEVRIETDLGQTGVNDAIGQECISGGTPSGPICLSTYASLHHPTPSDNHNFPDCSEISFPGDLHSGHLSRRRKILIRHLFLFPSMFFYFPRL